MSFSPWGEEPAPDYIRGAPPGAKAPKHGGRMRGLFFMALSTIPSLQPSPQGRGSTKVRKRLMLTLRTAKHLMIAAALSLAAGGLGACGVRGPLDPPPVAQAEGQAKSAESADAGENSAAKPKPHEDFILDPLLR